MKETSFTKHEHVFCTITVVVVLICVALAFWFAVPFQGGVVEASTPEPMIQSARVDLNSADLDALCTLPGIGKKKAQAILEYRRQNGAFRHVEDVVNVPGVTEEIVASWVSLAYVS